MLRQQTELAVGADAIAEGMTSATWPGRLQLLGPGPLTARLPGRRVWLDGGHNRGGALAIARQMAGRAPFDLIFGLTRTRWIKDVLGPFAPLVRKAHTIPLPDHAHHDPRDIAMVAQAGSGPRETYPAFTLGQAIDRLARDPNARNDVLIFGSLYLAGQVLAANGELPT
jgi:dihydrofolate synthase/folylpolyglutamate synthase